MLFEKRSVSLTNPPEWLIESLGQATYSNEVVTVDRALTVPAVLAIFNILSQDTASLPLILYRRLKRGKERATEHPYYTLMHDAPNDEMTSMVFREIIMGHLLGWGNFYGQLIWDQRGIIQQIYPLNPANMQVGRKDGKRVYLYQTNQGQSVAFTQEQILHIPAFGFDGLVGRSLVSMARNVIGLAMATEKYGNRVFANDARPSVALMHPGALSANAKNNLVASWNATYAGADNAAKVAVLEEGLDLKTIGFPSKDAQFIETQQWTISQFSRVSRIPEFMLGQSEKSTSWGTGIEQQQLGYLAHTLRPWMVRIEQHLNKNILLPDERKEYFFEHLVDAMLRTDINSRMQAYTLGITNGIYTRNEVREKENLLPYDGGDDPLYPMNMTTDGDWEEDPEEPTDPLQDDPEADTTTDTKPQRDITPLLMDALRRISKRDNNELQGALKRYAQNDERFRAWAEQFYKRDYPEFIKQTFQPLLDVGFIEQKQLRDFTITLITQRGKSIEAGDYGNSLSETLLYLLQEAHHA
jgi:HK97 family phage portal protein